MIKKISYLGLGAKALEKEAGVEVKARSAAG
jgi:hypothetical protein